MDFESYIGKERQLLARIGREREELNSHEPNAWSGNYQLAADEIKLLRAGDYVSNASGMAADAIVSLDGRMSQLRQIEGDARTMNETFLKRVSEWETKFDGRYAEVMAAMAREMATLETRNSEITARITAAERHLQEISSRSEKSLKEMNDRTENSLRQATGKTEAAIRATTEGAEASIKGVGRETTLEVERLIGSLKTAQAEFEAAVNEKLEEDKQTLERIRFMITTMNEIIKT